MRAYPKQVNEFIRVRMEQTPNNAQIARDVVNKFPDVKEVQDRELDGHRRNISDYRKKLRVRAKRKGIKRLFCDIETGYYILKIRAWQLKNFQRYFDHKDIEREKEIICISYKWQNEDRVYTLDWRSGEKQMLKKFVDIMGEADEIVFHNGDRFDLPFIRTRASYHGVLMYPTYRTFDTLKKARHGFLFASNKLDYLGGFFRVGGKKDHDGFDLWKDIVEGGDEKRLQQMIEYCERDVILLEDVFFIMSPFVTHNNNFAVLTGGEKWECPECASENVEMFRTYATPLGTIRREMRCKDCKKQYRVSNKTYMAMILEEMRKK